MKKIRWGTTWNKTRKAAILLLILLVCASIQPVAAQEDSNLRITRIKTDQFPAVQFSLEAVDSEGNFITELALDDVRVLENGTPRPLESLEKVEPGLQLIVAVNAAPMLGNFVAGVRQYDSLKIAVESWAQSMAEATPNDFSLSTNSGLQAVRESSEDWIQALEGYQPNFLESQPTLISFNQALELASDPNPDPRMKRAILYITPLPNDTIQAALPNLADRAAELNVRVFVWMVAPINYDSYPGAEVLRQLAATTGGKYFLYSGVEEIPDLESYFAPLRYQYEGQYQSRTRNSGSQQIVVEVNHSSGKITSPPADFSINVLPPNPMFLAPPTQIARSWNTTNPAEEPFLEPQTFLISTLVEFPDGHQHPLRRSKLIVDGKTVVENTEPPFDQFAWPLEGYLETGSHTLRIEIEDELGFISSSIETEVEVVVEEPPRKSWRELLTQQQLILVGALGITALITLFVLNRARLRRSNAPSLRQRRKLYQDPLTQPVDIRQEEVYHSASAAKRAKSTPRKAILAPARLVHLSAEGEPISQNPILILRDEITIGSDPQQSMHVLKEPSVNGIHTRLVRSGAGEYIISDAGSIAGTWVNYAPASSKGVHLKHGDLIHIGRAAFRFELSNPDHVPQPQITSLKEGDHE